MPSRFSGPASLTATISMLLLTACGGGGGSSTSASSGDSTLLATSTITSTNAKDVGAQTYYAVDSLNNQVSNSASGALLATGVSTTASPTSGSGLLDNAITQARLALHNLSDNMVTGILISKTFNCPQGGTERVGGNIASNAGISGGDTISYTANNCGHGSTTLNGSMSIGFSNISGSLDNGGTGSATLNISMNNFSVTSNGITNTANGDIAITLNRSSTGQSFSASGKSLQIHSAKGGTALDWTISTFTYNGSVDSANTYTYNTSYTLAGNFPKLGNTSYTVKTVTDFKQQPGGLPSQGALMITAGDNSTLMLTAINDASVKLGIDKNGDGAIDETLNSSWSELDGLL